MSTLVSRINNFIRKAPSVILEFAGAPEAKERSPKWNIASLYEEAETSWLLQEIFRTIIQETLRPGWSIQPKFRKRCKTCKSEFTENVDTCPTCDSDQLTGPNPTQYVKAKQLIDKPNGNRQEFGDILSSIIYHDLVADDWFISVAYALVKSLGRYVPKEIYVEDPRSIRIVSDERGRLGKDEYFCPVCYPEKSQDVKDKAFTCKICGGTAKRTSYIEISGSEIKNRFTTEQIVHGSTYRVLPYIFGSPRMVSIWEILQGLKSMDAWFYDTYKNGRVAQIINIPGYTPEQIKATTTMIREREQQMDSIDPTTGKERPSRRLKSIILGSGQPITVHPMMPDPDQMGALEYYRMIIQGIAGVFGVQLIFISQEQSRGSSNTSSIRIEVQNRTIEELQRDKEATINSQLFPIFGITDYVFEFGDLEKKDELRDAQIMQIKSNTASTFVNAGFEVKIDEDGDVEVKGEVDGATRPIINPFGMRPDGATPAKPKESEGSTGLIEGTTTERKPFGPRDDVG